MKIVIFCHSLVSDWNHGSAHFLCGLVSELVARGVDVHVHEPRVDWAASQGLERLSGEAMEGFKRAYPDLESRVYDPGLNDVGKALSGADAVIVHDLTDPALARRIGEHHKSKGHYVLLFLDGDQRVIAEPESLTEYELKNFDGVLA